MLTIKLNENINSGMLYAIAYCEDPDIYSEDFWGWDTESDVGYELMEFSSLIQDADVFDSLEAAEDRADDVLSSIFENEVFIVGLDPYTPHNLTGFVKKIVRDSINESKSIKEFNESSNNYKNYLDLVFKPGNILKLKRMFEFFDGGVSTLDDIDKAVIDAASKFVSYDYSYTDTRVKIIFPTGTEFEAIKLEKVEDKWYDYLIWLKEVSTGALVPIVFDEGEDPRDLFSGIPEYKLDNKSDEIDIEEVEDDLYFRGMRHDFGDYEDTAAYEMTDRAEDIFGMDHDTAYDLAWKVVSRMKDNGFEFEEGEEDDFLDESKSIKESSTLSKLVKSGYTRKEIQKFFKDETGLDMTPENSEEFKRWAAKFLNSINESKSIKESSLVDKKVSTLGKRGKPMYFTAAQLKDAKAKYPEYDFEEATIDKSLPQGQKAYIAKKKTNESKSIKEDMNDSDEVLTFKRDVNLAKDADEIQLLIYELSDGVAEDNAQQAFNENESNDLETLKSAVITAIDVYLEDNEWLGDSKSIKESNKIAYGNEKYKGYMIRQDHKYGGYNVYDREDEMEDSGFKTIDKAKEFIDSLEESKSIKESATGDYVEVAYICDGFTNFRVYGGGFKTSDALVAVKDEKGKRLRLTMGDVCEFYTWYDTKGNVIHEPTYYSED